MPQDASAAQKSDQIAHRFFTKTVLVADHARNVSCQQLREDAAAKIDKWFNLETPDNDSYKDQLRIYRSLSQLGALPPPLSFRVFLTVPELTANQVLVQHPPNTSRTRIEPTPSHILLESWTLTFRATTGSSSQLSSPSTPSTSSVGEVSLATVYKHIMSVIRSMYTMLRVLPAWRIIKRLRRRPGATRQNGQLGIDLRVQTQGDEGVRYLDFDIPLAPGTSPLPTATHTFAPITHPMGVFSLAVTYLTNPHFEVDTLEALLSSRFLSMDAGPEFTPTLARGTTRDSVSMSGSPTSLALRTSLPRSPPQDRTGAGTSVADRFVFSAGAVGAEASGSRASFPSSSPRGRGAALPPVSAVQRSISAQTPGVSAGAASNSGPGSGQGSLTSESRLSREDGRDREGGLSSLSRIRRESTGMGRGSDLPSSPGPVLIRRPSTNVNPFKSSTLSSGSPSLHSNSPSFRHTSPLPSLPSVPAGRPAPVPLSPTNARASSSRIGTEVDFPSSPTSGPGVGYRLGSSPFPPLRASPPSPFVPSSLGDRRFPSTPATPSLTAGSEGDELIATPPRRKRYSSSFGYRYAAGASDGSAGSGDKGKELERPSPSYLGSQTDDDDLRAFVQEIDNSRPLGRGTPAGLSSLALNHERERTLSEAGLAGRAVLSGGDFPASSSRPSFAARTTSSDNSRHHRTSSDSVGVIGLVIGTPARRDSITSPSLPSSPGQREIVREPARSASRLGEPVSDSVIESRLREMTDAFQASMGRVERRPSTVVEASETSISISTTTSTSTAAYTTASERERERASVLGPSPLPPYNPGPGAAHLRMPSFNAATGITNPRSARRNATTPSFSSSSSAVAAAPIPPNEVPGSGSGSGTGHLASIWDNRRGPGRPRTDSAGSGASNISVLERERERARLFYGQGHVARGSVGSVGGASHGTGGSVGSEEVVGRMELDR